MSKSKKNSEFILFRWSKRFFYTGLTNVLPTILVISILVIAYQFLNKNLGGPINALIKKNLAGPWQSFAVNSLGVDPKLYDPVKQETYEGLVRRVQEASPSFQIALLEFKKASQSFESQAMEKIQKKAASEDPDYIRFLEKEIEEIREKTGLVHVREILKQERIKLKAKIKQENDLREKNKKWQGENQKYLKKDIDEKYPSVIGLIIAFTIIFLVGIVFTTVAGRSLKKIWEKSIASIPLIGKIYPYTKQLTEFLFQEKSQLEFDRVVAVEYPKKGIYAIGFPTGDSIFQFQGEDNNHLVSIFIPSSPTPFTGYTIMVNNNKLIPLAMTVEEAIRFSVTGGVIKPEQEMKVSKPKSAAVSSTTNDTKVDLDNKFDSNKVLPNIDSSVGEDTDSNETKDEVDALSDSEAASVFDESPKTIGGSGTDGDLRNSALEDQKILSQLKTKKFEDKIDTFSQNEQVLENNVTEEDPEKLSISDDDIALVDLNVENTEDVDLSLSSASEDKSDLDTIKEGDISPDQDLSDIYEDYEPTQSLNSVYESDDEESEQVDEVGLNLGNNDSSEEIPYVSDEKNDIDPELKNSPESTDKVNESVDSESSYGANIDVESFQGENEKVDPVFEIDRSSLPEKEIRGKSIYDGEEKNTPLNLSQADSEEIENSPNLIKPELSSHAMDDVDDYDIELVDLDDDEDVNDIDKQLGIDESLLVEKNKTTPIEINKAQHLKKSEKKPVD